ncbi:MAG TPA: LuxR C-terminal-related transcriptional regulator [Mycobacteriales bacterium]|nr:LuxR C-terminal-related transcriptional regulator [Mycobacteriales bacterium]
MSVVPTSLIGRADELAGARAELAHPQTRLLTLTGPVGAGKSRLAAAVVHSLLAGTVQVWSADLAGAADPRSAIPAVVTEHPGDAGLLVLDNCDQLAGAGPQSLVAPVSELLAAHRGLTVLATSCEPLGLYGERRLVVGPLPVPAADARLPVAELARVPAVALFVDRARAAAPGFALRPDNRDDVAALCRELDGLPLALELAAGRIRVFPPRTLLARVRERLDVLAGRPGDTMSRHRTLRSALTAGWDRLDADEQAAVRRLSVFPGAFGLDAAQAVAGPVDRPADLLLESLLDRSALSPVPGTEPRFALLRTARRYAAERLAESGELAETYRRLAGWVRTADPEAPDRETAVAAVRWLLGDGDRAAAVAVLDRLPAVAEEPLVQEVLRACEAAGDLAAAAAAHRLAGRLAAARGETGGAVTSLRRSLALHRELGDGAGAARSLTQLGRVAARTGDTGRAAQALREAVELATADPATRALALGHLADALAADGDTTGAAQRAEEAVRLWTVLGDRRELARARALLAALAAARSDHPRALELAQTALRAQWELPDRAGLPATLEVFAELAATDCTGLHHQSAVLLGAAAALRDLTRTPPTPRERAAAARTTRRLSTALGPAALRSGTAQGRRADLAAVVGAALAARPAAAPPVTSPLTPREREVADLVARGLTNRQIARQLGIAEWTAVNHVRHIMRKLECPSRIHVARWMGRQD